MKSEDKSLMNHALFNQHLSPRSRPAGSPSRLAPAEYCRLPLLSTWASRKTSGCSGADHKHPLGAQQVVWVQEVTHIPPENCWGTNLCFTVPAMQNPELQYVYSLAWCRVSSMNCSGYCFFLFFSIKSECFHFNTGLNQLNVNSMLIRLLPWGNYIFLLFLTCIVSLYSIPVPGTCSVWDNISLSQQLWSRSWCVYLQTHAILMQ